MYFVSQKPKNIRLIGTENHNVYGIGDKNGCLVIYQKDCFDAREWDEFAELKVSIGSQQKCKICTGTMPTAAGIINSKMWVIASGTLLERKPKKSEQHVFCVDLETKEVTLFKVEENEINDFVKSICMKCDTLQITFEDNIDGKPRFVVQPNRLRTASMIISISNPYPQFKQFYFDIDVENQTCNFGYFDFLPENSKRINALRKVFVAGFNEDRFHYGLLRLGYFGSRQTPMGGDYRSFSMSNFVKSEEMVDSEFFYDAQNELHCIVKEKNGDVSFKLSIFKPIIDMENETVSLDFVSTFEVAHDFPDIQKNLIFTTPNLIIFSSSVGVVVVINRVLTLSESAYLALQNIPITKMKSFYESFKGLFTTSKSKDLKPKKSNSNCISMNYLRENFGISKNVSINHGSL
uniref:PTHB1 N-terminal domain-containing protein n=1 Tax=Panagrolaimus davidi TaxID=227884 RepID=A0A914QRI5_9BILA